MQITCRYEYARALLHLRPERARREDHQQSRVYRSHQRQGDLGRNSLRGFGAWQIDFSVQRNFALSERFRLQSEADFFNIFNHPNFGNPVNYLTSPQFGQPTQTLNSYLGGGGQSGGLNPLYQIGGPRSIQLALKLVF